MAEVIETLIVPGEGGAGPCDGVWDDSVIMTGRGHLFTARENSKLISLNFALSILACKGGNGL